MALVQTKNYNFGSIAADEHATGIAGENARHHLTLYRTAIKKTRPTILELGTSKGKSTTAFLQACDEADGHLYSVDIIDCSGVSSSPRWTFIKSDSADVRGILSQAPALREGIDILLIDTLHTRAHVEKEFYGWYPYLRDGSVIFFDDIDPFIYCEGQRKDNVDNEFDWQEIQDFVVEIYRSNPEHLRLEMYFGSTGLAALEKCAPLGAAVRPANKVKRRTRSAYWQLYRKLKRWVKGASGG